MAVFHSTKKDDSMSNLSRRILLSMLATLSLLMLAGVAVAQKHITGTLSDGATYVIDVPAKWNGTLLLYSHGYVEPGASNPAQDVGDPVTGAYLLAAGYAMAGSSYASTGWAVQQAIPDQISTLGVFQSDVGIPTTTIAWGHSLGGMITAGLVQEYPSQFNAALPMCGVLGGGVGLWNQALDAEFAFNTLIAGGTLQVVHISNPTLNFAAAETYLSAAQKTAQGQARIALTAALADTPGWYDPTSPEPAPTDYTDREANQFSWMENVDFPFVFDFRAELEGRAGGNPSFNNGVNYASQLKKSVDYDEVQALYTAAGLSLDADLETLKKAQRITADAGALAYLTDYIIYNGQLPIPVLTMHTTGDGLVSVQDEQAYASVVSKTKDTKELKETFVHRAGHCEFTPAETITALQTLELRLTKGKWMDFTPADLNSEAAALGSSYNIIEVDGQVVATPPAFETYKPAKFLRPYDAFTK
jgi:pimeloyl-ACP methyl ester carboxylesterase